MHEDAIIQRLVSIERLLRDQKEQPLAFNKAAAYLDVSKSFLYKLTCQNKIPHYKPTGKKIYFSKLELNDWLLRNPVKTRSQHSRPNALQNG